MAKPTHKAGMSAEQDQTCMHVYGVGSVADLRTRGRWFDPRLGQYSFRGLMIVIATGFSPLSFVSTMVMWESSQWLGTPGKHGKAHWSA